MNKNSIANNNQYMQDPVSKRKQIERNVWSSSAIEGIYPLKSSNQHDFASVRAKSDKDNSK